MNQKNSNLNPLTLFLPPELRDILKAGWEIKGFHKDFSGYRVHVIRGKSERVWHFDSKKECSFEETFPNKKDYIFS